MDEKKKKINNSRHLEKKKKKIYKIIIKLRGIVDVPCY